jgi:hypothetical protein
MTSLPTMKKKRSKVITAQYPEKRKVSLRATWATA